MFTIMHSTNESNTLYTATKVIEFLEERVMHRGTPDEFLQPPSIFLQYRLFDESGIHLSEGHIYVMNEAGKTVATFRLDRLPKVG